jgi:averantin hydroxylase
MALENLVSGLSLAVFSITGIFLSRFILQALYNVFLHPLRIYPGPKLWAASAIPIAWNQLTGREVHKVLEMHEKYGPVVRTAPDEVSYANPIVWKEAFAHRQGREEFGKSDRTRVLPPNGVYGIFFAGREEHGRFRRAFSAGFSERGMQRQQSLIKGYVDMLIKGLKERAPAGPLNMVDWFNWASFDIIGALAFGESFGCLEKQQTHPWIAAVFGNVKGAAFVGALRRVGLGKILPYIVPKRVQDLRLQNFQFAEDRIRSRMSMGNNRGDFMDSVLQKGANKDIGGLSFEETVSNASNIVLAGSETTATLLSGVTYQLLSHPEVLKRAVQEIRTSFNSVDEIDLFSTARLKYMLAVLDETMRVYPPVPTQPTRSAPPGGETIDGKYLPEKTVVYVAQYAMNRLEANFAKPLEFHPERFLNRADPDSEFANDNFAVFQPFSVGPRNCIGRNLAYAEMRLILARVLYEFDMELDERSVDWIRGQKAFVLWEKSPLYVKLKEAKV